MHRLFLLVFLAAMVMSSVAQACYTEAEIEAEQGVRIHSELMVIGLTCFRTTDYEMFSAKNADLIMQYERSLMEYYREEGVPDPEEQLHVLRASIANQISEHAVLMSVYSFCNRFSDRVAQATTMDKTSVREWASYVWAGSYLSEPVCDGNGA